jgi:hypothetical protein
LDLSKGGDDVTLHDGIGGGTEPGVHVVGGLRLAGDAQW